jgi:sugar-specific transcriptional regulator TrmB
MNLTEKQKIVYDFLIKNPQEKSFSAADLSNLINEKIAGITLSSMAKKGVLESLDTKPKTYNFLGGEISSITSTKKEGKDAVSDLFNLLNTIESDVQSIIHWMESDTYATEPGTQIGIYKIVEKETQNVIYVGKTERPFSERWKEHKELLLEGRHHSFRLQEYFNTLNKDINKISFEILQELPADPKIIDLRERFWIEKYSNTILNYMRPKLKK